MQLNCKRNVQFYGVFHFIFQNFGCFSTSFSGASSTSSSCTCKISLALSPFFFSALHSVAYVYHGDFIDFVPTPTPRAAYCRAGRVKGETYEYKPAVGLRQNNACVNKINPIIRPHCSEKARLWALPKHCRSKEFLRRMKRKLQSRQL